MSNRRSKTLDNFYKDYYNEFKETSFHLEKKEFKHAVQLIFKLIVQELFAGNTIKLPYNLGELYIDKFQLKGKKKIDFGASRKYGKIIYYSNLHSDGFTYKVIWSKNKSRFQNRKLYHFKLTRANSRELSKRIKTQQIKIFKNYG